MDQLPSQKRNDKPLGEELGWHLIDSKYLFESHWYSLRQDSVRRDGQPQGTYTYLEHPGSVYVVPVTKEGRFLLIRSYRFPIDAWCWEVPAGNMGDDPSKGAMEIARRELLEEAGATCESLQNLGSFYLGTGFARHRACFFLASDVVQSQPPETEPYEQIGQIATFSRDEVKIMVSESAVADGDSAFALLLALQCL